MIEAKPAAGALGAYIGGVDLADLDAAGFAAIEAALCEHQVLFFRDQAITPAQFQAFAARFGPVMGHPAYGTVPGAPAVQILESTPEKPSLIEKWHTDMTFTKAPPMATLLHGDVIPPCGGDTLWSSMTAAWEALSQPLRTLLAPLTAVHDFRFGFRESLEAPGGAERLADAVRDNPPVVHPVARRHPVTGRLALYVNPLFTTRIVELPRAEGDALLAFLFEHARSEEFTVRFAWQPRSLAIWDNRSTQHKPVNDYFRYHRRMLRVTVEGDVPAGPGGAP